MVERCRVKLDELHIGNFSASTVSHGNTVSRGNVRIGGVGINMTKPARGKHGDFCNDFFRLLLLRIKHISTVTVYIVCFYNKMMFCKQLNGIVVFKQGDVWMVVNTCKQRTLHFTSGNILRVHNAVHRMPTLFPKMQVLRMRRGKIDPKLNKSLDVLRSIFHHQRHHIKVAQSRTGIKGVGNMQLCAVIAVNCCSNAALCPIGIRGGTLFFRDDSNLSVFGGVQGEIEPANTTANNENISVDCCSHTILRSMPVSQKNSPLWQENRT